MSQTHPPTDRERLGLSATGLASPAPANAPAGSGDARLTAEEWEVLRMAPLFVFLFVARADGCIDRMEISALEAFVNQSMALIEEPLLGRLMAGFDEASAMSALEKLMAGGGDPGRELLALHIMLKDKLGEAESARFERELLRFGRLVAEASAGFFGFGTRLGREEQEVLERLAKLFGHA
jgi:hypothetical protein